MLFAVNEVWHSASVENMLLLCAISIGTTWTGITWGLRLLGVNRDLQNLKFIHLPILDLLTTGLHGITTNIFYLYAGMKIDDLKGNVLAMMLGDFTGTMLIMTVLWSALWLYKIHSQFTGKNH
jgi:ABC-type transport system involved in cytochrome c biogenesis permease subunit